MLGSLGGSVKSQMSSWLGGGIPGLRKSDANNDSSTTAVSNENSQPVATTPQLSNRGSPVDKEDEASR
ncbi:hypothetical protein O3M35_002972 [Rhynocoris fuscipes]|uniref:Uncharacterized protein n=1 Tax=Rhynocoris fuscipes TaxID=488301 RepID=A0AAW1CPY1_9HEMI